MPLRSALRAFVLLIVFSGVLPLVVAAPAPLMDWPSHLARVWITERVLAGDAFWGAHYTFRSFLIPNAVLDLGVLGLLRLDVGLGAAGTIFLVAVYGLFVSGAVRLARAIGTASALTAPLAVTCFYSTLLFYGLVNFVAGLAAMLWALAFWCGWGERAGRRCVLAVVATVAIALCHILAAFVFLGVVVCIDGLGLVRARGRGVGRLLPCGVVAAMLAGIVLQSRIEAGGASAIGYSAGGSLTGFVVRKATILARAMSSGQVGPDLVMAVTAVALGVAIGRARARMAWAWAVASGGLLAAAVVAPDSIGEGAFLDARFVPAAVLLACVAVPLGGAGRRTVLVVGVLVLVRMGWLAAEFHRVGALHAELETALGALPAGSMLLTGVGTETEAISWANEWSSPSANIASLAVTHGVFVPTVFASRVQQPLALREAWQPLRHYLDVTTPEREAAALSGLRGMCGDGPVSLLILHYRGNGGGGGTSAPYALFGPVTSRLALVRVC